MRKSLLDFFWHGYGGSIIRSVNYPSLQNYGTSPPTFNIDIPEFKVVQSASILFTSDSIDRRTTILRAVDQESGSTIIVKEQYPLTDHPAKEGLIIKGIHSAGSFLGIVRALAYGPVLNGGKEVVVRHVYEKDGSSYAQRKMRLVLKDSAEAS